MIVGNIDFDIPKEVSQEPSISQLKLLVCASWCWFVLVGPPRSLLFKCTLSGAVLNASELVLCLLLSAIKKFGI